MVRRSLSRELDQLKREALDAHRAAMRGGGERIQLDDHAAGILAALTAIDPDWHTSGGGTNPGSVQTDLSRILASDTGRALLADLTEWLVTVYGAGMEPDLWTPLSG